MRRTVDYLLFVICAAATGIAFALLLGVVGTICQRGLPAVSWRFLTEQIRQVGAEGGIFFNLIGTIILIATALAISVPVAASLALLERVYLRNSAAQHALSVFLFVLNGIPSILFGIFGFLLFVKGLGWGKSWFAGGILLGAMILPTVTVSFSERIKALPPKYLEAAAALGLTQGQVIWGVIIPQSWGALLTGALLGLARAAGETAPIMFTATIFAGATLPHGIKDSPVLSLPYHIFILAQDSFDPAVGSKLWGSALVLLGLVLSLALLALPSRLKLHEEANA